MLNGLNLQLGQKHDLGRTVLPFVLEGPGRRVYGAVALSRLFLPVYEFVLIVERLGIAVGTLAFQTFRREFWFLGREKGT